MNQVNWPREESFNRHQFAPLCLHPQFLLSLEPLAELSNMRPPSQSPQGFQLPPGSLCPFLHGAFPAARDSVDLVWFLQICAQIWAQLKATPQRPSAKLQQMPKPPLFLCLSNSRLRQILGRGSTASFLAKRLVHKLFLKRDCASFSLLWTSQQEWGLGGPLLHWGVDWVVVSHLSALSLITVHDMEEDPDPTLTDATKVIALLIGVSLFSTVYLLPRCD